MSPLILGKNLLNKFSFLRMLTDNIVSGRAVKSFG